MPLNEAIGAEAKTRLGRESDRYLKLARYVEAECSRLVRKSGIPATIQFRVKKPESLEAKLGRYLQAGDTAKIDAINTVDDVFDQVGDLAGVRVATYVEADRERVVRLIESRFAGVEVERHSKSSGYRATHCQVRLPGEYAGREDTENIDGLSCEIQVCSMLAHVWNEVEHDIRYKLDGVEDVDQYEISRLQALLAVSKDGDQYIEEMLQQRSHRVAESMAEEVGRRFPSSKDFHLRAPYVIREAVRLGYTTLGKIDDELLPDDPEECGQRIVAEINRLLVENGEEANTLNPDTSDILLALLLHAHQADMRALHFKELEGPEPGRIPFLAAFLEDHPLCDA